MDDYIKREDIVNLAVTMQTHLWTREQTYNAIFWLPSADAVPVVRCKDCKWYTPWDSSKPFDCEQSGMMNVTADDFCSYGER